MQKLTPVFPSLPNSVKAQMRAEVKVHGDLEGTGHTVRLLPTWVAHVSEPR